MLDSMPLFVKELLAGGLAKTAVAPPERIKILFQIRRAEFQSVGLVGSFNKIAQTEGVLGFYKGNEASVSRIVAYAVLHYVAYEEYRWWIIVAFPNAGSRPVLDLVAGSIAGGTAVVFTDPLDLVCTKLAYQIVGQAANGHLAEIYYKGIGDCLLKIYRNNGMRGL